MPSSLPVLFLSADKGNSADFDKLSIVVDKLLSLGAYKFQLTGGEPFIHPDIYELISNLKNRNTHILITTSGFYLNDSVKKSIKLLSGAKATIRVSIDGLAQTYKTTYADILMLLSWQSSF